MTSTNWDAKLYDASHTFVSEYGSNLMELLAPKPNESILDIGCGTGDLAKELSDQGMNVIGIDNSEAMIQQAKTKYPTMSFQVEDVTMLPYDQEFDAVFSNAVLHWVKNPEKALENIYRSLKKGGRFVAEFGGEGNVRKLTTAMIHQVKAAGYSFEEKQFPWYFPSIAEYTTLMEQAGFRVTFARLYDRPTKLAGEEGLQNWLTMFAEAFLYAVPKSKRAEVIAQIEEVLKEDHFLEGDWLADYTRIQVIGMK